MVAVEATPMELHVRIPSFELGTLVLLHSLQSANVLCSVRGACRSNYLSALIQCAVYASTLVDGDVPEHSELCNLRRQCDKYANESTLYRRRSENWISWGAPS